MTSQNRLASETSPYLLQHADNPVEWYPWGEEALAKARSDDKPILLSVGYSACHWCHVMAHESFEDPDTAAVMNRLFVNIKVDREERPDLDKIYQLAHQMLTQRPGGWPLTMFLTPDGQVPFFGGTYFPNRQRHGMPAFRQILEQIAAAWSGRREDIEKQNQAVLSALSRVYEHTADDTQLDDDVLQMAASQLKQQFDAKHGGFGSTPKFPHVSSIERLLRSWRTGNDKEALDMALFTLQKMALGGMNDQLGGGFCRYSTDDYWMIPHFEKMLYDNGVLLAEYAHAYAIEHAELFARTCHATARWVMREMQSPEGGYYSSYDADSEGKEGRFYVWTPDQVKALLSAQEYAVIAPHFGLNRKANFEGQWHFHIFKTVEELQQQEPELDIAALLDSAHDKLLAAREKRVKPGRDDKILTSWNGLMIRGMAIAARYLREDSYAESASHALDFIRETLWRDGRLLATCKDGKAHLMAYLDDYAFLLDAVLELLQVRWRAQDLVFARELADALLQHFEDRQDGGFWFVADDHETLIQRPKSFTDEAIPAGSAVAAFALQRLGLLTGEMRYLQAAESCLKNAAASVKQTPYAYCTLLKALEEQLHPATTIIIRGDSEKAREWLVHCNRHYAPATQSYLIPVEEAELPKALAEKKPLGDVVAYICTGMTCLPPVLDLADLP